MGSLARVLLALLLLGSALSHAGAEAPLPLFVSILPQKYITERVGGSRVRVEVMVGPGASPVTYEPTPRQMVRLASARLYYRIGVPFESAWMEKIRQVNPEMRVLDARESVPLRRMEEAGDRDHDHGDLHGMDPHIWLSPARLEVMASRLTEALRGLDPAHGEEYLRNFEALRRDLRALDGELRRILDPHRGKRFLVFHPSWGYFADDYGLRQVAIEREGKEPGGRALAQLIDSATREGVATVFVERQFSQERAGALARAIGAETRVLDPLAEDVLHNLRAVARALGEGAYE